MAQVLIRDLPDATVEQLRQRAKRHGRSLEGELRLIVTAALRPDPAELAAEMARIRAMTPQAPAAVNSTDLIREDRDRR